MNDINQAMNNLKKLEEMAVRVGITSKNYLVYVNTDDGGNIPHFHYVDEATRGKDSKKGFHTCIKLEVPEYFNHEGKEDKLSSKQKKELNEFLRKPFDRPKFQGTNWDYIVMIWNMNNSDKNIDEDQEIPDYTKLK